MTSFASCPANLAKKVKYFLARERKRDACLSRILDDLPAIFPAYLFGGLIRDIALFGNGEPFRSDLDIVCDGKDSHLSNYLEAYSDNGSLRRNKFGGFRIRTDFWSVDIWTAETTWAFKKGFREYSGIQSLLETTITNWEGILFPLRGGSLIYRECYFEDIRRGLLDIVLPENPNPLGMYVKVIRSYAGKQVSELSGGAVKLLREAVARHSFAEIYSYERSHYMDCHISESVYDEIVGLGDKDVGPLKVEM